MADNKAASAAKPATAQGAKPAGEQPKGQTLPATQAPAPAAPAAKAKVAKKTQDLSKLTPEQKAQYEKAVAEAKELRQKQADLKKQQDALLGISKPARASSGGSNLMGINPSLMVSAVPGAAVGFKDDAAKAVATKLTGNGIQLGELMKQDGVDFQWFRYRFIRGSLKVNGKTIVDILNGLAGPQAQAAA